MRKFGFGRATKLVAAVALVAGGTAAQVAITSSASAATPVTTEVGFRDAWANDATVVLGGDIDLTCQNQAGPGASEAARDLAGAGILDGQGFTITQKCPDNRVLQITGATGAMTIENVAITGGQAVYGTTGGAGGGGIQSTVTTGLTVINSNISGNATCENGGGIEMDSAGELSISGSTFSNNGAASGGGVQDNDPISVVNSTITGNQSLDWAGGIAADSDLTLVYSTVTQNEVGVTPLACLPSGLASDPGAHPALSGVDNVSVAGEFSAFGNIVAQPAGGNDNCFVGLANSVGFNFSDDDTCGFDQSSDSVATTNNPTLGALADNGGPTPTRLPLTGSPVIDAIGAGNCNDGDGLAQTTITTDQRELPRPETAGGKCDIGAVEVQAPAKTASLDVTKVVTGTSGNAVPSAGYTFAVSCSDGTTGTLTVANATAGGTSGTLDGIEAGAACRVTEGAIVYTKTGVIGQPTVTYSPAAASSTEGVVVSEGSNTVTVANDFSLVNLLGETAVKPPVAAVPTAVQPAFTG